MADYQMARAIGVEVKRLEMLKALKQGPLSYMDAAHAVGMDPKVTLAHLDLMVDARVVRSYMSTQPDANGAFHRTFEIVPEGLERGVEEAYQILESIK